MEEENKLKINPHCKPFNHHQSLFKRGPHNKSPGSVVVSDCEDHEDDDDDDDEEEEEEIERRVRALQRLVPGGEEMEMDRFFEETADYIEALRGQVSVMRALVELLEGVATKRRMMGG